MRFFKIMTVVTCIFFIGFPQVALAKRNHVPRKPFAFLFNLIEQFDNNRSTPGPQGPPGPVGPEGPPGPVGSEGPAGILEKYMKVIEVSPSGPIPKRFIVYCDNIPDDVAISGNAYTYWGEYQFQGNTYNDVLRPVCTYYGEDDPGPGLEAMTCQPEQPEERLIPIGWQFIQHPNNDRFNAHVVLHVMCIFAPDTQ